MDVALIIIPTVVANVQNAGRFVDERYTYDSLNRLSSVIDAQNEETHYSYDAVGNRTEMKLPNGITALYSYDTRNRLTALRNQTSSGQLLSAYQYQLDTAGRRTQVAESPAGQLTTYQYDELNRLISETVSDQAQGSYTAEYSYDAVGNRTYSTIDGVQTAYRYDENDRLIQQGGTIYSYDDNGNTLSESGDESISYRYDAANHLIQFDKNGVTTRYGYNTDGIRNQVITQGQATTYIVDSNREYAEVLGEVVNGHDTVSYTHGDELLSQRRNGQKSYPLYDGHGSVRGLSDVSGLQTDSYDYDAFGVTRQHSGSSENDYLYAGEQFDKAQDRYYLRARYYNQNIGRFDQMDSWQGNSQEPATLHKYIYGNGDPVNHIDPSGHFGLVEFGVADSIRMQMAQMQIQIGLSVLDGLMEVRGENDELRENVQNVQLAVGILQLGSGGLQLMKLLSGKYRKLCNSFTGETLVHTEFGLKAIRDIKIGEKVWAYDPQSGRKSLQEVTHLIEGNGEKEIVDITLNSGEVIEATSGHPFYVQGNWVTAGDLQLGNTLLGLNGEAVEVTGVQSEEVEEKVYNLTVANDHTYYVGQEGVLAHNINPNKPCRMPEISGNAFSINNARYQAKQLAQLGSDAVPYLATRPSKTAGKIYSGMQSPDGKRGWRLDFDSDKGLHINWWKVEDGVRWQGYISVPGKTQDDYWELLRHFPMKDTW